MRKLISMILCAAIITSSSALPASAAQSEDCDSPVLSASADEPQQEEPAAPAASHEEETTQEVISGKCGSVSFALYESGSLYIYGNGAMQDYSPEQSAPYSRRSDMIVRVVVEPGVESIGSYAFSGIEQLESAEFSDDLQKIGSFAFIDCFALSHADIPDSVTSIGEKAFGYRYSISPDNEPARRYFTFVGSRGSAAETYANENNMYFAVREEISDTDSSSEGSTALKSEGSCGENVSWRFDSSSGTLTIYGSGAMSSYYSYYDEEKSPFSGNDQIRSVVVEEGVTTVGDFSFYECTSIESVKLPSTLKYIGYDAFAFPDYSWMYIPEKESKLKSVVLPEGLETIESGAFAFQAIEALDIPASLTYISETAFSGCSKLKSFSCPEENPNYTAMENMLFEKESGYLLFIAASGEDTVLNIPDGIKKIGGAALRVITSDLPVKTIVFPASLEVFSENSLYHLPKGITLVFEGGVPKSPYQETISPPYGSIVYFRFSLSDWMAYRDEFSDMEVEWRDLDDYTDSLVLSTKSEEIRAGEFYKMSITSLPYTVGSLSWKSSDSSVAAITKDGLIYGVNEGKTTVTLEANGGAYTATAEITVKGTKGEVQDGQVVSADYGIDSSDNEDPYERNNPNFEAPCEELGGILFVRSGKLWLYSFASQKSEVLYDDFSEFVYMHGSKLYGLGSHSDCLVFDPADLSISTIPLDIENSGYYTALGIDEKSRIYVSYVGTDDTNRLSVFSPDGDLLANTACGSTIKSFVGFCDANGTFYTQSSDADEAYWYSGNLYLNAWRFDGKSISRIKMSSTQKPNTWNDEEKDKTYSCMYYLDGGGSCSGLLGGRYITAYSNSSGTFAVFDCAGSDKPVMLYERSTDSFFVSVPSGDNSYSYYLTLPERCVYSEKQGAFIRCEGGDRLCELTPNSDEPICTTRARKTVFGIMEYKGMLLLKEKTDEGLFFEALKWDDGSREISLIPEDETMKVGQSQKLMLFGCDRFTFNGTWTVDSNAASVTQSGVLAAWNEGKAAVTFTSLNGRYTASCIVTIEANSTPADSVVTIPDVDPEISNLDYHNYSVWSKPVTSYLYENTNGNFTRIQYAYDKGVIAETYSKELKLLKSTTLPLELPNFGGFYSGSEYNYIVTGQYNEEESDSFEVFRVTRYTKDFKRIDSASAFGEDTYRPFEAGSLRMTELNGKLYIHTCHLMYRSGDGLHHQSNYSFVAYDDPETNEFKMTAHSLGYSSHSFNQFVASDDNCIYSLDHGDAYPRAVVLKKYPINENLYGNSSCLLEIKGETGDNWTGVSVGGLALSTDSCLVVGNSIDMNEAERNNRNIFLSVTDKETFESNFIWLTSSSDEGCSTPHIVKLSDEQFIVMWTRYDTKSVYDSEWDYYYDETQYTLCTATVDGSGRVVSRRTYEDMPLSDCAPICASDGSVKWYVTNYDSLKFYSINPFTAQTGTIGDLDLDGEITSADALSVLRCSVGAESFDDYQAQLADIDEDGSVTSADALEILRYSVNLAASERIGKAIS